MFLQRMTTQFGVVKSTLIFSTFCILFSFLIYLIASSFFGQIRTIGVIVSLITPALVAPPVCVILLKITRALYLAQTEIIKAREALEEKVAERTQELKLANEQLSNEIEERKHAERALRESEERYRSIVENITDALYIHDFKGNILDVNEHACMMVGYEKDELVGANLSKIDKSWNLPENPELEELIRKGKAIFERQNIRKDGSIIPVEISVKISDPSGNGIIHGFVRDISDRKRTEAVFLHAQKLESLSILAGGIAHDFNNLMAVILGNLELAAMGLPSNHESYSLIKNSLQYVEQTKDLTNRLITFSKGGFPVKKITDISKVLTQSIKKMTTKDIFHVIFDIDKHLLPVSVDEAQFRQVFYNLTVNAFESMPEGGTLKVEASNINIRPSDNLPLKEGTYIKIIFADQGMGIAKENLLRIFDPYFTTKNMGTQKGMGLGLSVCYSVLKNHDGHVSVSSEPGKGTVFSIYIPAHLTKL